ncbi:MAG TPA: nitroreductase [Rhodanobacteraceae bacterium]|nr:nitroreductase [Rhodanobacteraceae bacterium]
MNALDLLQQRHSIPAMQLGEPGPDAAELDRLLSAALRVPDHGKLTPWRLLLLAGEQRREFGRRLALMAIEKQPDLPETKRAKDRQRYEHAPLVIAVIAHIDTAHARIPAQEQLLSAGCVAYNLLLGAEALGFGAQWLTGWAAYDRDAATLLGLAENEHVIGFIHIGTPAMQPPDRERPAIADKVSRWTA